MLYNKIYANKKVAKLIIDKANFKQDKLSAIKRENP